MKKGLCEVKFEQPIRWGEALWKNLCFVSASYHPAGPGESWVLAVWRCFSASLCLYFLKHSTFTDVGLYSVYFIEISHVEQFILPMGWSIIENFCLASFFKKMN